MLAPIVLCAGDFDRVHHLANEAQSRRRIAARPEMLERVADARVRRARSIRTHSERLCVRRAEEGAIGDCAEYGEFMRMTWRTGVLALFGVSAALALLSVVRAGVPGPVAFASPTPTFAEVASTSPAASPTPTSSASPLPPGTFENAVLGYRITLPQSYRRGGAAIFTAGAALGTDTYTPQTEQQERERCLSDSGDIGFLTYARADISVRVLRNVSGLSAQQWVMTPEAPGGQSASTHQKVEPLSINGQEAVRLVEDNARAATTAFVISARGRIYQLSPVIGPLESASIDDIAKTFVVIAPTPFPTPTATIPPRDAATDVAAKLAVAFAAKDADAVARLMSDCWLFVSPLINGQPAGGVQYRSVALFTQGLRARFAAGDLEVTIDQTRRTNSRNPEGFFVRSVWKDRERSSVIDLYLMGTGGRWIWFSAEPQDGWPCRRPWVSTDSC